MFLFLVDRGFFFGRELGFVISFVFYRSEFRVGVVERIEGSVFVRRGSASFLKDVFKIFIKYFLVFFRNESFK